LTQRKPDPTPIETFLAPLATLARKRPELEGLVFWRAEDGWPDAPAEALEAEEITFYAEGLLIDGFRMQWSVLALPEAPEVPDHIRMHFWQDDGAPPDASAGWALLRSGRWPMG
jgi:hypothetical protein